MHFEVLVEDQSGKKALENLIPKIIGHEQHTLMFRAYKGIGHIPKNLKAASEAKRQTLLGKLLPMLKVYGKSFSAYQAAVIVVCDLDKKDKETFLNDLLSILHACDPEPNTRFCLAIEEGEAWLLGDIAAIKAAYPRAKDSVLHRYVNDSICGTWELLADAVYPGGCKALTAKGSRAVGAEKLQWAEKIPPHMVASRNASPSFEYFRTQLLELSGV
jgi:hypothetical protein